MKTWKLSLAFFIVPFYAGVVTAAAVTQDLSPSLGVRDEIPTKTREKRDTQVSCDGLYGYPPPAACEAAMAMLPTDAPNMFGLLGPANIGFFSFEPQGHPFYMLDQEGDDGNVWAAGNCIIRLKLRRILFGAAYSETSTWTKIRAKVQEILDRCVTTLPSTGGYARVGRFLIHAFLMRCRALRLLW
ncbi:MAG: hypothetical protein M1835_003645 [Candelina submexicana]|nr:MAG: hypothetical protein M1835_003645 [Candelina submexicana]